MKYDGCDTCASPDVTQKVKLTSARRRLDDALKYCIDNAAQEVGDARFVDIGTSISIGKFFKKPWTLGICKRRIYFDNHVLRLVIANLERVLRFHGGARALADLYSEAEQKEDPKLTRRLLLYFLYLGSLEVPVSRKTANPSRFVKLDVMVYSHLAGADMSSNTAALAVISGDYEPLIERTKYKLGIA